MTDLDAIQKRDLDRFLRIEEGLTILEQRKHIGMSEPSYYAMFDRLERFFGGPLLQRTAEGRAHNKTVLTTKGLALRRLLRWHRAVTQEAEAHFLQSLEKLRD